MSALFKENALARLNSNMHIVHFTAVLLESVNETDINFASVVSNLTQTIGKDRVLMLLAEVKRRKEQNPTIPNTVGGLLLRMAKQHMTQDERRKVFKRHRTIRLEPATVATFSRVNNNAKRERERAPLQGLCFRTLARRCLLQQRAHLLQDGQQIQW